MQELISMFHEVQERPAAMACLILVDILLALLAHILLHVAPPRPLKIDLLCPDGVKNYFADLERCSVHPTTQLLQGIARQFHRDNSATHPSQRLRTSLTRRLCVDFLPLSEICLALPPLVTPLQRISRSSS